MRRDRARAAAGPDVASLRALPRRLRRREFKVPEQVVIWESLPKNDAGKVLKHQVRAALTNGRVSR